MSLTHTVRPPWLLISLVFGVEWYDFEGQIRNIFRIKLVLGAQKFALLCQILGYAPGQVKQNFEHFSDEGGGVGL